MSYSVYNGLQVNIQATTYDPQFIAIALSKIRADIELATSAYLSHKILERASFTLASNYISCEGSSITPSFIQSHIKDAYSYVVTQVQEASVSAQRNPEFDIHCSITMYDAGDNKVYAIPSYELPEFGSIIKKSEIFSDFSYWNSSDKPDLISDAEWDARYLAWKSVSEGLFPFYTVTVSTSIPFVRQLIPRGKLISQVWSFSALPEILKHAFEESLYSQCYDQFLFLNNMKISNISDFFRFKNEFDQSPQYSEFLSLSSNSVDSFVSTVLSSVNHSSVTSKEV